METFPDDILLNIFIRLPAKQLAQMRSVSKSWNALLSQSSFIKSHLDLSIQNNNDKILLVFPHLFSFASKPFTAHPSPSPHLELPDFIKLPINPLSVNRYGQVIGSVNGLICFRYGSNHDSEVIYRPTYDPEVIYIWNPSLSALLTLPPYHTPSHSIQQFFRFGFDPKTEDYKVVKIARRIEKLPDGFQIHEWLQTEVYSMRKGSWKLITQKIPSRVMDIIDCDSVCVDGHLYWVVETDHFRNVVKSILSFDLNAETFREIPFPDAVTCAIADGNVNDVSHDIAILAGKLCVISKALPGFECEVWVMEEYGVVESWVKHHVFPPFNGDIYPYGFTLHNEVIFKVVGRGLALYDPVAAKTKSFKYCGGHHNGAVKVVDYVDSLVWVTPDEQREMNCCSISRFQF